jgi:acylphosphatase
VGFRYFTQGLAERLHLSGYVRNLPDARVEVYAIGTLEQLAKLRTALERGPRFASVSEVQEQPAAIDPQYAAEFVIAG